MDIFERFNISPEKKRIIIMNGIRYISLFMLVLGYILIIYLAAGGDF
jgi:hypothetical protein